jgi:hypothetical protein
MKEQLLKAEYIVIEESARLLDEIKSILPESRDEALFNVLEADGEDLPEGEFRKKARTAVIRELLEYLETELNPPPRQRPRLVKPQSSKN